MSSIEISKSYLKNNWMISLSPGIVYYLLLKRLLIHHLSFVNRMASTFVGKYKFSNFQIFRQFEFFFEDDQLWLEQLSGVSDNWFCIGQHLFLFTHSTKVPNLSEITDDSIDRSPEILFLMFSFMIHDSMVFPHCSNFIFPLDNWSKLLNNVT